LWRTIRVRMDDVTLTLVILFVRRPCRVYIVTNFDKCIYATKPKVGMCNKDEDVERQPIFVRIATSMAMMVPAAPIKIASKRLIRVNTSLN
jgi:hypothetical protein